MKKIGIFITLLLSISLVTGCTTYTPKKINDKEVYKMMKDKKDFILEVTQTGCSACEDFAPTWKTILKEYKIKSYSINLSDLSKSEHNKFSLDIGIAGTPNVIFFKDGEEETVLNRIIGSVDKEDAIAKLKINGYIKKDK
ncbi:MAG: thioredoxin family protein [Bacilli bacterium]